MCQPISGRDPSPFETNYDAEALISFRDSLYTFTKQWRGFNSRVYSLPKEPGHYSASVIDSIETNFMVTGADVSLEMGLVGYNVSQAFFMVLPVSKIGTWHTANVTSLPITTSGSMQVESFAFDSLGKGFFTSESNIFGEAALYGANLNTSANVPHSFFKGTIFPNPFTSNISFLNDSAVSGLIFNLQGQHITRFSTSNPVDLSFLPSGNYQIILFDKNNKAIGQKMILKY